MIQFFKISLIVLVFIPTLRADASLSDKVNEIKDTLEEVKIMYEATGETNKGPVLKLTAQAVKIAKSYIGSADNADWKDPTSIRMERVEAMGAIVRSYQSVLLELGFSNEIRNSNPNAISLLYYAEPNIDLKHELLEAIEESSTQNDARAFDILVNLRMDDPQIRDTIIGILRDSINDDEWNTPLFKQAKDWKWRELVPVYDAVLNHILEMDDPEDIYWAFRLVTSSIDGMGKDADTLIPKLEKILELIENDQALRQYALSVTPGALDRFNNIIYRIENDIRMPPLAVNGSGLLEKPSVVGEDLAVAESEMEEEKVVIRPQDSLKESPSGEPTQNNQEEETPEDMTWLYVLAAIVVICFAAYAFRKKE